MITWRKCICIFKTVVCFERSFSFFSQLLLVFPNGVYIIVWFHQPYVLTYIADLIPPSEITLISAWINNNIPNKVWNWIIHPFPNVKLSVECFKLFHPTLYWVCDFLSMLGLELFKGESTMTELGLKIDFYKRKMIKDNLSCHAWIQ